MVVVSEDIEDKRIYTTKNTESSFKVTVHPELNINFVVLLDGTNYTSSQLKSKIGQLRGEGNWYYINSIPLIEF